MASCFSFVSIYESYIRRAFLSAGLRPETYEIDDGATTIKCWTEEAKDKKPYLVLIHGFGPSAMWQWRQQVRGLSPHFHLIVPDLIFFGGSTTRSPHRSEVFQAGCVVKLLDRMGIDRFSAIGTSYGGFVAYHVARICGPERVERVVIASSDLMKSAEDNKALLERAGKERISDLMIPRSPETLRTLIGLSIHKPPTVMPDFVLRDFIQTLYSENVDEKMELLKGLTLDKNEELQFSPLLQEVLIVWGEHDLIFPLEKAYHIKKHLGEKARLVVMRKTAHIPHIENPGKFNDIVKSFLLGTPKSSL